MSKEVRGRLRKNSVRMERLCARPAGPGRCRRDIFRNGKADSRRHRIPSRRHARRWHADSRTGGACSHDDGCCMSYELPQNLDFSSKEAVKFALVQLQDAFHSELKAIRSTDEQEQFRIRWFGDKAGLLNKGAASWIRFVPAADKRDFGSLFNLIKESLSVDFRSMTDLLRRQRFIQSQQSTAAVEHTEPPLDISLPGIRRSVGVEHPLTHTMREMTAVFAALGLLGQHRSGGRNRLLQLRSPELPAQSPRAATPRTPS